MKAILLHETGGADQLLTTDIDTPGIGNNDVLIQVKAISVNPVDYKVRGNDAVLTAIYGPNRPAILGWDIAGIVIETGADTTQFSQGDHVFGMVNFLGAGNAYAEYVAAPAAHLAKIPANITFEEAAATTLAALTALQVLRDNISAGDRVLIHAGSGGVGHFAIQIAKALGAYVISTSSARNKDFVLSLGADQHIDYTKQRFEEVLADIDFIFDMFNGDVLLNSVKLVKPGGKVVSIPTPEFSDEVTALAAKKNVALSFHMVQSSGSDMQQLAEMLEHETIKPHVSKTFAFEDMALAHKHLESGRTVGKVVVTV